MNTLFDKPTRACSLLKPTDKRDDLTILTKIQQLYKKIPGVRIATLKKDGVRAVVLGDLASRTIKKIPNLELQKLSKQLPYGLDVELYADELEYNDIQSIVMEASAPSEPIKFHILDLWDRGAGIPYTERLVVANYQCKDIPFTVSPEPIECPTAESLFNCFLEIEKAGGEGICWRLPDSIYFQKGTTDNRGTLADQLLIKLARPIRSECRVIGFEEQMYNANPPRYNALGKMDRSKSLGGMIPKNTLGAFLVEDFQGIKFRVATGIGLTDALRAKIWAEKQSWLGAVITIESKSHGVKMKPRSPIFVGRRNEIDL